jgi:hypothetical protein
MPSIKPIARPNAQAVECPLPFVSPDRLEKARGTIASLHEEVWTTLRKPGSYRDLQSWANQLADQAFTAISEHDRFDRTALEVVAYYGLLGEHPEEYKARAKKDGDEDAAARLAVWGCVHIER